MNILQTAIALVCAFSSPDCAVVQQLQPVLAPLVAVPSGKVFVAETLWDPNRKAIGIIVGPKLTHPVAVAAAIAHEARNVRDGYAPECGRWMMNGFDEQYAFRDWFNVTFGAPADIDPNAIFSANANVLYGAPVVYAC